ncbi:protein ZNRD2 isoform X2 [Phycodurus eques]|uniref:protein ZNRD2 isoform X2 n=1 Tax=Phycodurus eques TaxID=693459 RepID=UPI002ACD8111|nr:protein ZNRD2 isoform X2 [Phycodurus eques]
MSLNGEEEDLEWEPPTDAEMKVIQARRERQDQISKVMGGYLLKGYKMLAECCDVCGNILMQDRTHKNYCVSCQELDSDVDKDNPALNAQAALSQVRERHLAAHSPAPSDPAYVDGGAVPQPRPEHCEGAAAGGRAVAPAATPSAPTPAAAAGGPGAGAASPAPAPAPAPGRAAATAAASAAARPVAARPVLRDAEEAVLSKMRWASSQLQSCASLESSIQLCQLISSCAASLRSLREISQ